MGVWLGPMGSNKVSFITENDYEYTNASITPVYVSDGQGVNWEIVLKGSGKLKFKKNPGAIDIFMVGGGSSGGKGSATSTKTIGGNGGQGGECKTFTPESSSISRDKSYEITIGNGGVASETTEPNPGGSTTFKINDTTILTALGGGETGCTGAVGGAGAKYESRRVYSTSGNPGTFAFEVENASMYSPSTRYGGSGGGGSARLWTPNGYVPTGFNVYHDSASGGASYGGVGGYAPGGTYEVSSAGGAARLGNTGSGGGGGAGDWDKDGFNNSKNGGAGAAGIIIIRNHRS